MCDYTLMHKADERKLKIHLLRQWLLTVMSLKEWTAYEWAKRAGIHPSQVQRAVVEEPASLMKEGLRQVLAEKAGYKPPNLDIRQQQAAVVPVDHDDEPPAALPTSERIDGSVEIPEYDVRLSAGGGSLIEGDDIRARWRFSEQYVRGELRAREDSLNMVEVVGDSMEPKLHPGDRIIVNQNDTNPTPPGIFALWDGYGLVVKHVQRVHKSDPEKLLLVSENANYPAYEVMVDEIKIIGRVVSCLRRM